MLHSGPNSAEARMMVCFTSYEREGPLVLHTLATGVCLPYLGLFRFRFKI